VPKTKQPPPEKTRPSNQHGGARPNAGRPEVYTLKEKMALKLRIAEMQKFYGCSRKRAVKKMQRQGELPQYSIANVTRYITPKHLNSSIAKILDEPPERIGIIAAIPLPKAHRRK
jgi:hypothetical protein